MELCGTFKIRGCEGIIAPVNQQKDDMQMIVYLLCYKAAWMFAESRHPFLSGLSLLAAAVWLYAEDYKRSGNMLHLRALFSLAFVGGQGLACLKLSRLGQDWSEMTWLCFLAAYAGFYGGFWFLEEGAGSGRPKAPARRQSYGEAGEPVFISACAITAVSLGCFLVEASALGFIPLLVRGVPHAYSYFHLTGIHYFTVSCVLVPSLCVVFFCMDRGRSRIRTLILAVAAVVSLAVPVLCVSRSQLLFAVLLAVLTYVQMENRRNLIYAGAALAALVPLYVLLTVARSHDAAYLNAIFEIKREELPLFLTQPYMYIANNYDNFNCLVWELGSHTWGMKMLTPFWTLSGLKFLYPSLTAAPVFVNKEELTTLTLFYDAYYDFGLPGVLFFSCLLGAVSSLLLRQMEKVRNPVLYLFYAQMALYLLLSFFTTWFSNPVTWFYLAATAAAALLVSLWQRRSFKSGRIKRPHKKRLRKGELKL